MFNLKRLFGRKEQLNDAETAYVEGRASEAEAEQVRQRIAASPERLADLESLRATVNVLRSVQSEIAPRSFALAEAPAYARSPSRRMGFAPAMAAIIAAVGVGLLAVGDLTGVVDQSGSGTGDDPSALVAQDASGPEGAAGAAGGPGPTAITSAGAPTATTAAGSAPAPTASTAEFAPDSGYGMSQEQYDRLQSTVTAGATEGAAWDSRILEVEPDSREPAAIDDKAAGLGPEQGLTMREDGAIALPLWQLQVSLAGLAALMIAAWAFIRRRTSA